MYIIFGYCPDSGSYFNVMPWRPAHKFDMKLQKTPLGLSSSNVNGGELDILGIVKMLGLGGDGKRKHMCSLVGGEGAPTQCPSNDCSGGTAKRVPKFCDSNKAQMLFWESEEFITRVQSYNDVEEFNENNFSIRRTINRIEREETYKEKKFRDLKEKLQVIWVLTLLADSWAGCCMNMAPSTIKYRLPKTWNEWKRVKRNTAIMTPVHYNLEAEKIIRHMIKDYIIEESTTESK